MYRAWNSCKESLDQNMSFLSEDSFLSPLFGGVSHKAGTLGVSREELCSPVLFQWLKYDIKWEPWVQSVCCLWESHRQKAGMRVWGSTSLLTPGMTACLLSVTQGLCFLMKLFSTWNRICELGVGFLDIFGKGQIASEPASRLLLRNLRQRHRLTWWPLPRWVGDHGVLRGISLSLSLQLQQAELFLQWLLTEHINSSPEMIFLVTFLICEDYFCITSTARK